MRTKRSCSAEGGSVVPGRGACGRRACGAREGGGATTTGPDVTTHPPRYLSKLGGGVGWRVCTGLRERGNDTGRSTGRSGRQNAATRRSIRREVRVTVQGPVKEQQPDGMSHEGSAGGCVCGGRHPDTTISQTRGGGGGGWGVSHTRTGPGRPRVLSGTQEASRERTERRGAGEREWRTVKVGEHRGGCQKEEDVRGG